MPPPKVPAKFIEPMLLLRTESLPEGGGWLLELKLDGYRAVAFKTNGKVHLRSRNGKDFSTKYPAIAKDDTVIDGEIVALEAGRPSFNALQNHGAATSQLFFYVFDIMIAAGVDVMAEPLEARREILRCRVLSQLADPIRESPVLEASLPQLIQTVKAQGLEGLVAKRRDSRYEPGQRSGAWRKMRVNQGREFVIAGYTPGPRNFDAVIIGHCEGDRLVYVARTRNGFTPASREALFRRFKGLETAQCPFANLPEAKSGRWGVGLTAEKMGECRWLVPVLVGQFEFLEWTPDGHLRHARFLTLREGKQARHVRRKESLEASTTERRISSPSCRQVERCLSIKSSRQRLECQNLAAAKIVRIRPNRENQSSRLHTRIATGLRLGEVTKIENADGITTTAICVTSVRVKLRGRLSLTHTDNSGGTGSGIGVIDVLHSPAR